MFAYICMCYVIYVIMYLPLIAQKLFVFYHLAQGYSRRNRGFEEVPNFLDISCCETAFLR